MGAINTDEKGKEILSSLNCYLQKIWEDVSYKHFDQLKNDKLKEDNKMLLEALKMVVNMDSWIRYFGNGSIDKKLKEAIIKAEPK